MHNRRSLLLRLLEWQRGLVEGTLDRPALLVELKRLYGELGGNPTDIAAALPAGTQLAIDGEQGARVAKRRETAATVLRERAERIVRYWIARTGRDAKRTEVSRDRVRTVAKVLRTKTDEEAMQAIANVADDDWRQGDNDRGKRYDAIEHIFGKGIERFEELRDSGEASLDVELDFEDASAVGKKPKPEKDTATLRAELDVAIDRKKRAKEGGDRDAFNRWSREERRLRRALGQGA